MNKVCREFCLALTVRQEPKLTDANDLANHIARCVRAIIYCIQKQYDSKYFGEIVHQRNDGKLKYWYRIEYVCDNEELDCVSSVDVIISCLISVVKSAYENNTNNFSDVLDELCVKLISYECREVDDDAKYLIKEKFQSIIDKLCKNISYIHAEIFRCETSSPSHSLPEKDDTQAALFGGQVLVPHHQDGGDNALTGAGQEMMSKLNPGPILGPAPNDFKPPVNPRSPAGPELPVPQEKLIGTVSGDFHFISLTTSKPSVIRSSDRKTYYTLRLPEEIIARIKKALVNEFGEKSVFEVNLIKGKDKSHDVFGVK